MFVAVAVCGCCWLWCGVGRDTVKTLPCVRSKRPRVYRQHVIFRVLTLMLSLNPQHTATQHTSPQQHHNTPTTTTHNTDKDRERQDNATQDKRRLQAVGYLNRVMVTNHTCLFEFLTILTFRALRGNHIVSTPFQTIVEENKNKKQKIVTHVSVHTLTFHETHYPSHLCFSLLCVSSREPMDNSVINYREDDKRSN